MSEKVVYLFAKDKKEFGVIETQFVVYEGSGPGFVDMEIPTILHYRDLQKKGYTIESQVLPNGFPAEKGFRVLSQKDLADLKREEWELDHPGISVEIGQLIERLKQGAKKRGLLWVFDLSFAPEYVFEFPDIQKMTYFLMGKDGTNEQEPFYVTSGLNQFTKGLGYFKEVLIFRNTSQKQAESFRDLGVDYNSGIVEHNLGEDSVAKYFERNPPICRPLDSLELNQLSQGGIEVLLEDAQP